MTTPTSPITVAEFQSFFDRDFSFGATIADVRDKDITRAITDALVVYNPGIWPDTDMGKTAFYYLTAHQVVMNINAAGGPGNPGQGINSGSSFAISSKSAGGLSAGYSIPASLLENPVVQGFIKTRYGQKYLDMALPYLIGVTGTAWHDTRP
jgi:hypothetical protein